MERQKLTTRLQLVYDTARCWRDKVGEGRRLIDVGSDHGFVSLEGLITGDYDQVVATDIHEHPASKTRELLAARGYGECSRVVCTDGLNGVNLISGDTVIMAGLGGNNMMDIISRAKDVTPYDVLKSVVWCLQPQKTIEELRVYLCANGFEIKDETVINDRGIFYPIVVAVFDGISRDLSLEAKYYGPIMMARKDDAEVCAFYKKLDEIYAMRARGDEEVHSLMVQLGKID